MTNNFFEPLPSYHKPCNTRLEQRAVPVDEKILSLNPYPVNYCPKCKVYIFKENESENPVKIGELITLAQKKQNIKTHSSVFNAKYLNKIRQKH